MTPSEAQAKLEDLFISVPETPEFPPVGSRIAIYGAGNCGQELAQVLQQGGWEVAGILDRNSSLAARFEWIPGGGIDSPLSHSLASEGVPVILCIFNPTTDIGAIALDLVEVGFKRVISYYEARETFSDSLLPRFWLATKNWILEHKADLRACLDLLADSVSRQLFLDIVEFRLNHNLQSLRNPDTAGQYFPDDLPVSRTPLRFVDGGAYTGDGVPNLIKHRVQALAAFEPDSKNFRRLAETVREFESEMPDCVALFPCGLGETTETVRFEAGKGSSSSLAKTGDTVIQLVALDEALPTFSPTYIKLDVEGSELSALLGCRQLIRKNQPSIAACVYHFPEHLWEVPQTMRNLAPNHQIFLRLHGFNGFEVVAYAIPPANSKMNDQEPRI